ncbi:P13 family porin [Borrelia miyamotoi]|uniref:P13 family porin n=1 Tax=Borrelia miyamotoi TaxID=47466 RepID=UPI000B0D5F76|nr:P13 family porin [Borrelia miyamotoi]WAZ86043.1 P13 family porin [Borrelia miyamotoi]WAZ93118.1 P13 family porin [Borrelia miyamotoi]WAZ94411.1 P13 family porin [Borrelia miyamotoi]WAZ95694.1 P13 family porin [Borrelia miyamotoi]WAZ97016.1 P13 family porin [Borrelia miyamotoi]
MKQVLSLILFFICIIVSFAQSYDEIASGTVVTEGNVDNKVLLYEVNKRDILAPFLLNFFFGFGIGSFVQGDITGDLMVLGSEILGLSWIGGGIYSIVKHTGTDKSTLVGSGIIFNFFRGGGAYCCRNTTCRNDNSFYTCV